MGLIAIPRKERDKKRTCTGYASFGLWATLSTNYVNLHSLYHPSLTPVNGLCFTVDLKLIKKLVTSDINKVTLFESMSITPTYSRSI